MKLPRTIIVKSLFALPMASESSLWQPLLTVGLCRGQLREVSRGCCQGGSVAAAILAAFKQFHAENFGSGPLDNSLHAWLGW